MSPLYEVTVDGEDRTVITADGLIEAWGDKLPSEVAIALDLKPGGVVILRRYPIVQVRRIR